MAGNILQKSYHKDLERAYLTFNGVILDNVIGDVPDLQNYFEKIRKEISLDTKILVSYHNPAWEPILNLASSLGLRKRVGTQNWLDQSDLKNLLSLSGFKVVSSNLRFFGITTITTAKPVNHPVNPSRKFSVSIIVPARNEEGNILKIIPSIPNFGKWQEIIFVEGNSTDDTWAKIKSEERKRKNVVALKQRGIGKADAVSFGISKARGDILMVYDADRTVDAGDLSKFYNALASGICEFANGSRLVYPMEKEAMQTLNKIGNQIFGWLFTKILDTRYKDTLCGTKAIFRHDLIKYIKDYKSFLKIDPFGDFALIFTAARHKLKVVEIPVRYKERVYGETNIKRYRHGWLLLKMVWYAARNFGKL